MKLEKDDRIVTAWAEACSGPGWQNNIVWVLIHGGDGRHRVEALQPGEQGEEILSLFEFSALTSARMLAAVERLAGKTDPQIGSGC